VRIEVPALQNEQLLGKLIYVGQTVNPETRTVLVRTELDNTNGRLKPSMLASMLIESTPKKQLVIPTSAVVREQDADYVFVQEKPGVFRLKPVRLTSEHNGQRVVLDGLSQGVKIVSDGAFHLNNHRNLKDMEKGE
jgi:cobalt-zinc-cadmium efflux system membrane fusion protein